MKSALKLTETIESAKQRLPDGWEISLTIKNGISTAALHSSSGAITHLEANSMSLADQMELLIGLAIEKDSLELISCHCGKSFPVDSFNSGFTSALGHCPECHEKLSKPTARTTPSYTLVKIDDIKLAISRAQVFDDGGDGADPESARSCIGILEGMLPKEDNDN